MNSARCALLRLTAGMVIATLAVAGCGADPDDDATDPAPSTSTAPETPDGSATTPGDEATTPADDATDNPSPNPSDEEPAPSPVVVEIRVRGGQVSTETDRVPVAVGDTVRMIVRSDVADEIHVHGIEEVLQVEPGQRAVLEFLVPEGTAPGLYEVETHDSALLLLQLEVT